MKAKNFFIILLMVAGLCFSAKNLYSIGNSVFIENDKIAANNNVVDNKSNTELKTFDNSINFGVSFFINFLIDISTVLIIVFLIYYPSNKKFDYIFTFIIFNIVIFLLTYVLNEVKISMGAALGLFAIFSMLRYRTDSISMKEMTYLFTFIAIGLISATQLEFYQLLIINCILIISIAILDSKIFFKKENSQTVIYDNIYLTQPSKKEELLEDLKNRTGFNIHRISIESIDMIRNSAKINIYYYD